MIAVSNLSIRFGKRTLFEEVSVKFSPGCRYGLIGANGVGKSTFMKILAGELDSSTGQVSIDHGCRMSFLRQDHYKYDDFKVIDTVFTGNDELWNLHQKRDELYDKLQASHLQREQIWKEVCSFVAPRPRLSGSCPSRS